MIAESVLLCSNQIVSVNYMELSIRLSRLGWYGAADGNLQQLLVIQGASDLLVQVV